MSAPLTDAQRRALQELSALIGVRVEDVRRERVIRDGRPQPQDNGFALRLPTARYGLDSPDWTCGEHWSRPVESAEFRAGTRSTKARQGHD